METVLVTEITPMIHGYVWGVAYRVSDTDTPWIRPGYVLSRIQKNRIRIASDTSIRHAWGAYYLLRVDFYIIRFLREKPQGGGRK